MSDPRAFVLADALKALGINPDNDPVYHAKRWIEGRDNDRRERDQAITERDNAAARVAARDMRIADLERDLAAKDDALKTANAAAAFAERRAKEAEQALKAINLALLDVGAPRAYTLDDKSERPISDPERIRILGDRRGAEWREKERVNAEHAARGKEIADAHLALNDLEAPRLADSVILTTAARIRAIPH